MEKLVKMRIVKRAPQWEFMLDSFFDEKDSLNYYVGTKMALTFYNSLTNQKEEFIPLASDKRVTIYSCGPTVYNFAHIGNFRAYIFSDLINRTLSYLGYKTQLIMNITDIDDKTIKNSVAENLSLRDYTDPYIKAFHEDIAALKIEKAFKNPRATDYVPEMIKMIDILKEKGHTYEVDGSTYFRISSFPNYGKLSNLDLSELKAGAGKRVAADEYEKEDVCDFVLWKGYVPEDGENVWDSPFGKGRPGWHIECSAMSTKYLGDTIDIHTGGMDNRFPHHENEIAQTECVTGKPFVRFWMHCSHLMVNNQKMSKSLGNFYTLRDLFAKGYSPEPIRYLLLASHYRNYLNFTLNGLEDASKNIKKINAFIEFLIETERTSIIPEISEAENELLTSKAVKFKDSLEDDLNTSGALGSIFELIKGVHQLQTPPSKEFASQALAFMKGVNQIFNVFSFESKKNEGTDHSDSEQFPEGLQQLLDARKEARATKQWALSDTLRDQIASEYNFIVKDSPQGQVLEPKL